TLDNIRNATVNLPMQSGKIIPKMSVLLQNYPNPFNPETWIPYHLKDASPVSISIYNATGQLVRVLDLGHKDAGIYASRSKAAYWDGKNQSGEAAVSGIYFYSIKAGDFASIRKMTVEK
ncbi:T9SS type A sorting domain-containing protein, partial [Candidatus Poribacteria bacterium]|nr:T9SS type A sorting domain-containing protein [Candidatus Poribacteria bacterium]